MIGSFFKSIVRNLFIYIKEVASLSKLQNKYPNCEFYSGAKISNSEFGNYNVIFNDVLMDYCNIGDHSYIQKKATIFNAKIGKFCSIASGVSIGPGIHKMNGISTHPAMYLNNTPLIKTYSQRDLYESSKTTVIGNDVWIGERAIILDGIEIGNGAVIAAGAVVTKNVIPYSVVGGVPAKHIKFRFDPETIECFEKSEWWNYSDEWFGENADLMLDVDRFKEYLKG